MICTTDNPNHGLTWGKKYDILHHMMNGYVIINDNGNKVYCQRRFNLNEKNRLPTGVDISELRETKLNKLFENVDR